jgi:prepilin-type N-terminal cleavage/methylation domain-containing protein/prepilin-type processing-associated H-X9-DG protein
MKRRGFTLIELLVVIAIIGLLLAVVIPALNKAKEVARELICKTNIKTYGLVGTLYLGDNDNHFPYPWCIIYWRPRELIVGDAYDHLWHDASHSPDEAPGHLWPYLENKKVNVCPVFDVMARSGRAVDHETPSSCFNIPMQPQFTYSMNAFLGRGQRDALEATQVGDRGPFYPGHVRKLSDVTRTPAQVGYFGEESMWKILRQDDTPLNTMPFNDNVLLVKGGGDAFTIESGQDPTPYADCLASFHKTNDRERMFGRSNVAYIDGHVDMAYPIDSFHEMWPHRGNWRMSDK